MEDSKDSSELKELVRLRREERGWTQERLAKEAGTNQQTIGKIEKGTIKRSSFLPQILTALGVNLDVLTASHRGNKPKKTAQLSDNKPLFGPQDFPVHGAAEGGQGALIVTTDPVEYIARPQPVAGVRKAYGIIIVEDSMSPEFEPGDIAIVHPHLPPRNGCTCVFYSQSEDGTTRAIIKRLRRATADAWHVRQWNPGDGEKQDFTLKRADWQTCHVTVGRYTRR